MDAISRAALGLNRSLELGWEGFTRFREPHRSRRGPEDGSPHDQVGQDGAPDRGRTCNLQLRRLTLY
ncbi:MAG TPA: hypothetical protein VFX50_01835, partial [Gemmatimonadales bacterium]|nr:hypothetical protein [Gemmatimonadales bacterium]